jgi:uncharacterized protein YbjT (DUF2867 family)
MTAKKPVTVVVAGASGFIGTALCHELSPDYRVIGLSRGGGPHPSAGGMEWRTCDLFSLFECEQALAGADAAFYLVHSMLPSARLTQGSFQDLDLISADNFARAAAKVGVRHIIYLGGMIPDQADLSRHILSRQEVESTLGAHGVPVTTLRAGIIIGLRGSSYGMFRSLLERLPVIPCPRWSESLIQPVALSDTIRLLRFALEHPGDGNNSYDIGGRDIFTYREMLRRSAALLGLKRLFIRLPFSLLGISKNFLALVSGFPRQLVSPLVESLKHSLVARDLNFQQQAGLPGISFAQAVADSLAEEKKGANFRDLHAALARAKHKIPEAGRSHVRSVQRIPLPPGKTARWLALRYMSWLPRFFHVMLRADTDAAGNLIIRSRLFRLILLELRFAGERSEASHRQLFYISGGILTKKSKLPTRRPRLEFREVLNGSAALVAIHDYQPTLPWPLYNLTQARAHLWVMSHFARAVAARSPKLPI